MKIWTIDKILSSICGWYVWLMIKIWGYSFFGGFGLPVWRDPIWDWTSWKLEAVKKRIADISSRLWHNAEATEAEAEASTAFFLRIVIDHSLLSYWLHSGYRILQTLLVIFFVWKIFIPLTKNENKIFYIIKNYNPFLSSM